MSHYNSSLPSPFREDWRRRAAFAAGFLAIVFILGGSSREDAPTLVLLRPISAAVLIVAAARLGYADFKRHWPVFTALALMAMYMLASLAPLPAGLWSALPGRDLIDEIDRAAGLGEIWRPMSMAPDRTEAALFALLPPFAMACLLARLDDRGIVAMLPYAAAILALSALASYFQVLGLQFRIYPVSTPNAGLMANRNHQALLLAVLVLMLFVIARRQAAPASHATKPLPGRLQPAGQAASLAFLGMSLVAIIPLVFIVGSRAGLVLVVVSLVGGALLWNVDAGASERRSSRATGTILQRLMIFGAIIAAIGVGLGSRKEVALQRLLSQDASDDFRIPIWQATIDLIGEYFPFGSGVGSFVEAYQIYESPANLRDDYVNHAHNDYLEIAMTAGLPGLLFMIAFLALYAYGGVRALLRKDRPNGLRRYNLLGYSAIFLVLLASVVDYPLRVPAIACLAVYAVFLARYGSNASGFEASGEVG